MRYCLSEQKQKQEQLYDATFHFMQLFAGGLLIWTLRMLPEIIANNASAVIAIWFAYGRAVGRS